MLPSANHSDIRPVHPLRCLLLAFAGLLVRAGAAQTFDVEQFEQLFRPRVTLDLRHLAESAFLDTTGHFGASEAMAVGTFPICSRFKAGFSLDTAARGLNELLKNSVRVRASQVLGSVRFGARPMEIGFDGQPSRDLYSVSIGVLGVKLTRNYRVLYWSGNVYLSEEDHTFDRAVPRFNGLIGKMRVKGLRRTFFYGLGLAISDHLALPVPFIGGNVPISRDWSFQYLLPAQVAMGFTPTKRTKLMAGIALDVFRSGIAWQDARTNLNYGAARTFLNLRHKASRHFEVRAEVGYNVAQTLRLSDAESGPDHYPMRSGPTFGAGVNVYFGDGVMERIIEGMIR